MGSVNRMSMGSHMSELHIACFRYPMNELGVAGPGRGAVLAAPTVVDPLMGSPVT